MAEGPADPAAAHPCLIHPPMPVKGTCARCGKFYCEQCLDGLEFGRGRADLGPPVCADCKARLPAAAPALGGWLMLPALHLGVMPFLIARALYEDLRTPGIPVGALAFALVLQAGRLTFSLYAAINFFQKKRRAIFLCIAFYGLGIAFALLTGFGEGAGSDSSAVLSQVAFSVTWMAYFLRSTRVQATFVVE